MLVADLIAFWKLPKILGESVGELLFHRAQHNVAGVPSVLLPDLVPIVCLLLVLLGLLLGTRYFWLRKDS